MQRIQGELPAQATEARLHRLFLQGCGGDADAYRAFLAAAAVQLRAFYRRRLQRWPDDVEDLVQECLLALHNQRASYDAAMPLTAWMHAIARYKLIDWLRRHARQDALNDPLDDADGLAQGDDNEAGMARRDLALLLESLPDKQRAAIVLTKLEGLSVREAAGAMAVSEADVKVSVHRGLKGLAAKMKGWL
jgi:RNA polymerase sigma factor (sigma-70 family)